MPLITQDQFFELWFPTSYWAQQFGGVNDPNNRRNARESPNGSRQFQAAWEAYNRDQMAAENPSVVRTTPYSFDEPAPTFTQWGGPCYDQNCRNLRASIESTERANYSAWLARKSKAESAEQQRLYEAALLQEADIKSQVKDAEIAAEFLRGEQSRVAGELAAEQKRISDQQKTEQENIQNQILASRLATEQEMSTIKAQFEAEKATNTQKIAEAAAETAKQQVITKRQVAVQQKAISSENVSKQQMQAAGTTTKPEAKRSRATIGQPGVAVTRVSARSGVGGYGGTAPTRVNPTGLNI